jgi:hypothetical protein
MGIKIRHPGDPGQKHKFPVIIVFRGNIIKVRGF